MKHFETGRELALYLLKEPTARDLQKKIGASQFSGLCARCVGDGLLAEQTKGGNTYWLSAVIGTGVHAVLEEHAEKALEDPIIEKSIYIGTLEGYGEIWSKPDLYYEGTVYDWKGLALDTELPTPTGWTTMGAVKEGDTLLGPDGKPTEVVAKSEVHSNPCYKITFTDGTTVVADDEHLWKVTSGYRGRYKEALWTTKQMAERGVIGPEKQRDFKVPNTLPLDLPEVELPIDPYVLGVWLGDGHSDGGVVTTGATATADAIWEEIKAKGFEVSKRRGRDSAQTRTVYGLSTKLRELGLLNNKHVPAQYFRASERQRRELLAGLLDTDGYYNNVRKCVDMQTASYWQAEAIYDLAVSLGWAARINEIVTTWQNGKKKAWAVTFSPDEPVFKTRNQELFSTTSRSRRRLVKSIEPVETVPTQCIQVDNDVRMYLCTRAMVPTHNTTERSKAKYLRLVRDTEADDLELTAVKEMRFKVRGYYGQIQTYAWGLVQAGHEVENVSIVFINRDGKTDDDIISLDYGYDQDYAERLWARLERIWAHVRTEGVADLPRNEYCFCSR